VLEYVNHKCITVYYNKTQCYPKSGIIPEEFVIPTFYLWSLGMCTGEFWHAFLLFLLYYLPKVHPDTYTYIPTTHTSELLVDLRLNSTYILVVLIGIQQNISILLPQAETEPLQ
jgi:hypothetical protein